MANYPLLKFSAGELSELVDCRSDIDKYPAGCRILENMIPRIYGPATRRPGTKYIDTCNGVARALPFIYSNTIAYILLLEDLKMYFYYDGGRVLDTWGRRLYIDTPYLAADLFELQYKQSNDVMWIVHNAYAPRKLTRTTANSFSLDSITFNKGPFMKRNDLLNADGVTMTPSVTTGSGTLTASSAAFDVGHIGALFAVTQPRVNTSISGTLTSTGVLGGSSILTEGPCTLNISDGWSGTIQLQRSIDDGVTWEVRRSFYSNDGKRAIQYTFTEEEDDVLHRVYVSAYNSTYNVQMSSFDEDGYDGEITVARTSSISGDLTVDSSTQTGRCRVTGYLSSTQVSITVLKDFASTSADTRWYEGCWSPYRGYPKCVTFLKERCVYAATTYQPQTLWLSAVDDFENFDTLKNNADDAFSLTLSSDTRNGIQWITGMESLLIGTTGGEWRVYAETDAFSKENFELREQTQRGSKQLQALPCGDVVLFADFVGRKIRELTFEGGVKYKYISPDLTALSEHITESGVTDMAFQRNPDPILWCTRGDGTLLSMTYEREQNVIGWARHPFDVGGGADGSLTGTNVVYHYPTIQALASSEIPATPAEPADTPLVSAISVTDAVGLAAMTPGNHYSIDADIDLTGVAWTPLNFSSSDAIVIEGNNKTISNLNINSSSTNNRGLINTIGGTGGCEIRNLNFTGCSVTGQVWVGILASRINADSDVTLKNITFTSCTVDARTLGGMLAGAIYSDGDIWIYNCDAEACTVTSQRTTAGSGMGILAGNMQAGLGDYFLKCVNCEVTNGTITMGGSSTNTQSQAGLFTGQFSGSSGYQNIYAYDCTASGSITINGTSVTTNNAITTIGGFISASTRATLVSCSTSGTVTINAGASWVDSTDTIKSVGGFVGKIDATNTLIGCSCSGDITIQGAGSPALWYIGGFAGLISPTSGDANNTLTRCYSTSDLMVTSDISATRFGIGGFAGQITADDYTLIERSWSEGDITFTGTITDTSPTDQYFGGFVGLTGVCTTNTTIQNCYTWTSIIMTGPYPTAHFWVSGFAGASVYQSGSDLAFENSYAAQTDSVAGSGYVNQLPLNANINGFSGNTSYASGGTSTDLFFDSDTAGTSSSDVGDGHETTWMQTKANYTAAGWDFDTIWYLPDPTTWDYTSSGLGPNSVAVIPSGTEDEVWLVVSRAIGGVIVRYLEQMQPRDWGSDDEDQWFVDSGLSLEGADADGIVTGLGHLEGEEVAVFVDGAVRPNQTVTNGQVDTQGAITSKAIVGIPFRYKLKPMRMDFTSGTHTTQTQIKRIGEVGISFWKSGMVEYGKTSDIAAGTLFKLNWRTTEDYDSPPALFTGTKICNPEGGFDAEDDLIITGNAPVNCTVRALLPRIETTGR